MVLLSPQQKRYLRYYVVTCKAFDPDDGLRVWDLLGDPLPQSTLRMPCIVDYVVASSVDEPYPVHSTHVHIH